jgi:tetratricopeptide (TPR) repeat protein
MRKTMDMRWMIKNILFISACILTFSCGRNNIDKTLDYVENIVTSQPDSALALLDSIKNPYSMTKYQYARHAVLSLYAKDLTDEDISNDTVIIYARDYLKTAGNSKYLAFAEYYLGRIYQANDRNEQALQYYLDAQTNAEHLDNDNDIKGLINFYIGQLHYNKSKLDHAIDYFKLSLECFNRCQDYKRAIPAFIMLGNTFLIQKNADSAFIYYNNALQLAETHKDSVLLAIIKLSLGTAYWNINKSDTAIKQLYQALELNPKLSDMIYLNLSCAYEQKNMIDSAKYFAELSLDLLKAKNNISSLSTNYLSLSRLEKRTGNYSKALDYLHKYNKCIEQINAQKEQFNIDEIEKKHSLKLLNESKDKIQLTVIVILILILFIISIVTFMVYFRMKNRKLLNSLFVENEKIQKSLSKSENELNSALDEKEKLTIDILQVYKDACILIYDMKVAGNTQKEIDISEKIFPQGKWQSINRSFNTLFASIRKHFSKYNDIKEQDIQIICLTCIDFSIIEISVVLDLNKNTAQQMKTEIRKKLGMNNREKIKDFVLNSINMP